MDSIESFKSDGSDQRCFRRFGVELPASVCEYVVDGNQPKMNRSCIHSAVIKDLSLSGLNYISKQHYNIGQTVAITTSILNTPVTIVGTIRRCQKDRIAADCFEIGIQFIKNPYNNKAIPVIGKYIQHHSFNLKKK